MSNQSTKPAPTNSYEQTKMLMEQTGKTGMVDPLMRVLKKLLEDPTLKKTMEAMPANPEGAPSKSDKIN